MKDYKFYYFPVGQKDKNGKLFYMPKPIIDIGFNFKKGNPIMIKALLDSGADHNLIPANLPFTKAKHQLIMNVEFKTKS